MKLNCNCNCHFNDNSSCDCCKGVDVLTPMKVTNPPGLYSLGYRVGTHATFLETMKVRLGSSKFSALKNLKTRDELDSSEDDNSSSKTDTPKLQKIVVLGIKAAPFGHNAGLKPVIENVEVRRTRGNPITQQQFKGKFKEWQIAGLEDLEDLEGKELPIKLRRVLALDAQYEQISPESWVAIERADKNTISIYRVEKVENISKTDYGIVGRVTQLSLDKPWLEEGDQDLEVLRNTTVYLNREVLFLAEKPLNVDKANEEEKSLNVDEANEEEKSLSFDVSNEVKTVTGTEIELDNLYESLHPGRWLIISGERSSKSNLNGVKVGEIVMLAGVEEKVHSGLPEDKPHTLLKFAQSLTYDYKRDTVTIYGNVVKATHGETQTEILGSGDASAANQQFTLSGGPLTYLPALTPTGIVSTLEVYINDVRWHKVESLHQLSPTDHSFVTHTDNDGNITITFGDGKNGARLPTGVENVKAVYRIGIGKVGNAGAEQINQLAIQPLGLKSVINPLPATGGANPESRDQIRRNVSLGIKSLNRVVSIKDYVDFAHNFSGIGKASAVSLYDGVGQIVHLTIAGADDIPITKESDLYRNFFQALQKFGDPYQSIRVDIRQLMWLIVKARVRIKADYQWELVTLKIRTALFDTFSFERREFGQDVVLSEVISTIQQVAGVDYVDVDILDSVSGDEDKLPELLKAKLEGLKPDLKAIVSVSGDKDELEKPTPDPKQPLQRIKVNLASSNPKVGDRYFDLKPAQLAILSPQVAETLTLTEIKS